MSVTQYQMDLGCVCICERVCVCACVQREVRAKKVKGNAVKSFAPFYQLQCKFRIFEDQKSGKDRILIDEFRVGKGILYSRKPENKRVKTWELETRKA